MSLKILHHDIYGKESPSIGRNQILDEFMPIRIPIEI